MYILTGSPRHSSLTSQISRILSGTFCFFCSSGHETPAPPPPFFFNLHPSPPSLLPVGQHSVLLWALCGGLACVNMTD